MQRIGKAVRMTVELEKIATNRTYFLRYLRQCRHKGAIASDAQGQPDPPNARGACVCTRMVTQFYDYDGLKSNLNYRKALHVTAKECRLIQAMNDSSLTFKLIADILATAWHPFPVLEK